MVVLVDGAMGYREFGAAEPSIEALRDGTRSSSTTVAVAARAATLALRPEREIDDLRAVIAAVGGDVVVLGQSSGAALAFRAAAAGVPMRADRLRGALRGRRGRRRLLPADLERLIADGKPGKAVDYFMMKMVGGPWFMPVMMRSMPKVWKQLQAVAPTLRYDSQVMAGIRGAARRVRPHHGPGPGGRAARRSPIWRPTRRSPRRSPVREHVILEGQTHNVSPEALRPEIVRFFA